MQIKQVWEIQIGHNINVRNGYTQEESRTADHWITRFESLAAYLGWDHEIDNDADEDSKAFKILKSVSFDKYQYHRLTATYEIAGLVAENKCPVKMDG